MGRTFNQIKQSVLGKNFDVNSYSKTNKKGRTFDEIKNKVMSGNADFSLVKAELENRIGINTFETDLSSMSKILMETSNGWQTPETMKNTRLSVESMQSRLSAYKDYQRLFGNKDTKSIEDLQHAMRTSLDNWDNLSNDYAKYKNADAYNAEKDALKSLYSMSSKDIQTKMDSINDIYNTANILKNKASGLQFQANKDKINVGANPKTSITSILGLEQPDNKTTIQNIMGLDTAETKAITPDDIITAENEYKEYLKSVGYKSLEDIENAKKGVAYTTADGQNITWKSLYDTKKHKEDTEALYKEISSREDFEKYKNEGANIENPTYKEAEKGVSIFGWKPFAEDVENPVEYSIDNAAYIGANDMFSPGGNSNGNILYTHTTMQERELYNYYLGRERAGLEKEGTADEYLKSITGILKDRHENKVISGLVEYTDEHPVLASGISVGQNLLAGAEYIKDSIDYIRTGELDTNHLSKASSTVRNTVSQKVDWEIGNWDAFDFLYNTTMSGIDSAVAMTTFGGTGGVVLGLSAAAQGTNDALERGLDNKSAFWNGFSAGVFEGLFETYSIGKFKAFKEAPVDGVKSIIKNIGKSMLTNASEETLTELANITYDYFANGDLSQAKTDIRAYMSAGMSEKDAIKKVALEQGARVVEAGASGALMGIGFGGISGVAAYSNSKSIGKDIKSNERVHALFDLASNPETASAYEAYTEYANKGITSDNISDAQLGRLYTEAKTGAVETIQSKKTTREQKAKALSTLANLSEFDSANEFAKKVREDHNIGEKTEVTYNGEAVDIKNAKIKNGDLVVETKEGEASVDDLTLTQSDAEIATKAQGIAKTDGDDVANLFLSQYDGKTDVTAYANDFNLAVSYGKNDFTFKHMMEHKGSLTPTQVSDIYKATVIAASKEKQERIKKLNQEMADKGFYKGFIKDSVIDYNNTSAEGKVNWNDLTLRQRQAVTFIKGFAQATGMNLVLEHNPNSKHGGNYNPDNNVVTIDISRFNDSVSKAIIETIIPTMSHETTHWMKEKSPELWKDLNEIVFSTLTDHYNSNTEQAIKDKIALLDRLEPRIKHTVEDARERTVTENDLILAEMTKKGKSREVSREEIIARACEDMLKMSEEGRKIFNSLSEEEQKTLVGKIKSIINDLLTWIDEFLNSYDSQSTEARIMREYKEELQKASKIWDEMLKQSVVANQSLEKSGAYKNKVDGDVLFETRFVNGNEVVWIEENILEDNNGQPTHQFIADFIAEHIGDAYTIIESGQKVYIGEDLPGEYTQSVYTQTILQYNKNIIKAKNKAAANIKEIIEIATNRNWEEAEHTDNKDAKYGIYKYNTRFAFPVRDTNDNIIGANVYKAKLVIRNASDGKKYLYDIVSIKKDKASSNWLSKKITSPTNKAVGQKSNVSKISIHNSNPNVKTNFSAKDSTGRELSEGQMEYFKDSTVRDEDGNLLVMYRGDSNEFTVFDRKKSKYSNLYGRGFYFTKNKAHAEQYGKAREFYLDIKNPLSKGQNSITKKQMLNFLKAIENDGEDYDLYNYGQDATAESVLNSVWGKGDFEMIQDINAGAIGDLVAAVELFNEINGTSYDGIVLPTETVTFNSEQAKLTSNLNPTKDKDIRFSMRDNVEETKDLVAVHNLSPEKLLKTLKLGGLPMPSIAITRAREGYNDFGEISLVFNKETIDPKFMRSNKVYSGDAWTPTYPRIEYKLNEKAQEQIKKKIDALVPRNVQSDLGGLHLDSSNMEHDLNRNGDMVSSYRYNYAMKYAFLKDNNVDIELPTMDEPLYRYGEVSNTAVISFAHKMVDGLKTVNSLLEQHSTKLMEDIDLINGIASVLNEEVLSTVKENSEEYQKLIDNPIFKAEDINLSTVLGMLESARKYFHLNGKIESKVDYKEARTLIDEKVDMAEYESWLKELFTDIVGKEGIRNNKDTYTPSGNRRSFEALHYEHNLENVIRAMKEEGTKGIGGFGGRNIFGASTNEYRSIDDIKTDAENRMQQLPESKYDEIKKGFSDRFLELASSLPIHKDSFTAIDDAANMLVESVSKFKTKSGMANYLRTESKGWANYSDYIVDDLVELVNDIRNMPVAYFEAKPQRAVGYDEIKAVIMPEQSSYEDDLSEVKGELEKLGIPILEYEYGDNNARLKALNSLEDVRFSDREDTTVYDLMGERDRLLKENERFKADIERLKERLKIEKQVTKGNYFNENQLDAVAGHLRNISNSTYDKAELIKGLKDVYSFIAHTEQFTWEDVYERTYKLAEKMLTEAKPQKVIDDYSKMILRDIRGKKIAFSESQKNEAQYIFGKNWNRNFFGRANITDGGVSLDSQWQEWSTMYPNIFDANISDSNMVGELYDIINSLTEASETIMEYNVEEQTRWLANEIYNQYWNVSPIRTTADKYDKQIKLLNFEHRRAMKESRDEYNSRLKAQHKEDMAHSKEMQSKIREHRDEKLERQIITDDIYYGKKIHKLKTKNEILESEKKRAIQLVKDIRERKNNEIARAKELGKQRLDKFKENAERKTRIQSITAVTLSLADMYKKNSKDKHIPEIMKGPVRNLINAINFSSKRLLDKGIPTQKDISLQNALKDISIMMTNSGNAVDGAIELYGAGLDDGIKKMVENVDEIKNKFGDNEMVLQTMSLEDLKTLDLTMKVVRASVNKLNKFHVAQHNAGVQALAIESTQELESRMKVFKDNKKHFDKLKTKTYWNNLNPYYAFKNLGNSAQKIFKAFQDAQDKVAFLAKEIIDFTESLYTDKEYKKWSETFFDFDIKQPDGKVKKLSMNIPQIMSLYCVSKQEDARRHLIHGNQDSEKGEIGKGRGVTLVETEKTAAVRKNTLLTEADLNNIISKLDKRQREVADKLQNFMATRGAELGNEISMARWGIKSFGIENYFPIKVSDGRVSKKSDTPGVEGASLIALLNMSFTHARNQFATQSIEIGDVFDVFANHMSSMIQYNAMALPVLDMYKWINTNTTDNSGNEISVETSVKDTFGDYAWNYIHTFLKDVNGTTKDTTRDNLGMKFFKNAKVAKVGFKLRVALLQVTSFFRAGAVMDNKYLLKAFLHKPKIKHSQEYCGMALWKSLGYFDTDITRPLTEKIKHTESAWSKLRNFSLWGAGKADEITLGYLWNACELEVRETRKDLKVGSEEFFKEIGLKLRDVIYQTQVVDSQLTRSQMMRGSAWDKMLTSFASENALSFNLVTDMFVTAKLDKRAYGKEYSHKKNKKRIRKTIIAYATTGIATAALQTTFDALMDFDEDDKDEEYILELLLGNFLKNVSFLEKVPYINLVSSFVSGFSASRMEADWMEKGVKFLRMIPKIIDGQEGSEEKAFRYLLDALSNATGVGAYAIYQQVRAFLELLDD